MTEVLDCVIIGGGPAGLTMGYQLTRRSQVRFVILERGELGQSWRDMHDTLTLLSPMYVNQLPGYRLNPLRSLEKVPKEDFVDYMTRYAARFNLPINEHEPVERVEKDTSGFVVHTSKRAYHCRTAVSATGYFSSPLLPPTPTDNSIPLLHSSQYKSPQQLRSTGISDKSRVLIVGKRISAGQLLEELHAADYKLGIAARATIQTRTGGLWGRIKEHLYYLREYLRFRKDPYIKGDSSSLMEGGKTQTILASGQIELHPPISHIVQGEVHFEDGTHRTYELIISATGYRHHVNHLAELVDCESPLGEQLEQGELLTAPGMFFLGLDNQFSFKSRYLRGIVSDSSLIAERILNHLAGERPVP